LGIAELKVLAPLVATAAARSGRRHRDAYVRDLD